MGLRAACQQWGYRVAYNFMEGFWVGSERNEKGAIRNEKNEVIRATPKEQPVLYRPLDSVAQATSYDLIEERRIQKKVWVLENDNSYSHYEYHKISRIQRRWDSFINFIFSPFELLSWAVIFLFQVGKLLLDTVLWSGLKNIVIPLVLSVLTVLIVPLFQSMWDTALGFYKSVRGMEAHNDRMRTRKPQHSILGDLSHEDPPSRWRILPAMIFFLIGSVWGAVRGVVRALLMLLSEVDTALENVYQKNHTKNETLEKFLGQMFPQLFIALGIWLESIANHLNNIGRMIFDHQGLKNNIDGGLNSLPHIALGFMEMVMIRPIGIVLAFFSDILVFWDVKLSRTKAQCSSYKEAWRQMWDENSQDETLRERPVLSYQRSQNKEKKKRNSNEHRKKHNPPESTQFPQASVNHAGVRNDNEGESHQPLLEPSPTQQREGVPTVGAMVSSAGSAQTETDTHVDNNVPSPIPERGVGIAPTVSAIASLLQAASTPGHVPRNESLGEIALPIIPSVPENPPPTQESQNPGRKMQTLRPSPLMKVEKAPSSKSHTAKVHPASAQRNVPISDGTSAISLGIGAMHMGALHTEDSSMMSRRRGSPTMFHMDPMRPHHTRQQPSTEALGVTGILTTPSETYEESSDEGSAPNTPRTPAVAVNSYTHYRRESEAGEWSDDEGAMSHNP